MPPPKSGLLLLLALLSTSPVCETQHAEYGNKSTYSVPFADRRVVTTHVTRPVQICWPVRPDPLSALFMLEHIHFLGGPPPQVHLMRSGWSSVCQSVVVIESEVAEFLWAMVYSAFYIIHLHDHANQP